MKDTIRLFVGYDQREAIGYHVFCQSVIQKASAPVSFHPLHGPMLNDFDGQQDGTNRFIYSRYLVPSLCGWEGWAVFADGSDMVAIEDVANLWQHRDSSKAVMVVKHDYRTKHSRKYIGTPMESDNADYPKKNWSSVVLWNCAHPKNKILTSEFVAEAGGKFLHRFEWLKDEEVGELPPEWNALSGETDVSCAAILHYTLGVPGFKHYRHFPGAEHWFRARKAAMHLDGED